MPNRIPVHQPPRFKGPVHKPAGRSRLSAHKRGYTRKWEKYRKWFLSQLENALCQICQRQPATEVDHKIAIDGPMDPLFWEPSNHQPACHSCHSRKTATEDGGFGRKARIEDGGLRMEGQGSATG